MLDDRISGGADLRRRPARARSSSDVLPSEVDVTHAPHQQHHAAACRSSPRPWTPSPRRPSPSPWPRRAASGIIHKNMTIEAQAAEVDKVKRSESGMIVDPVTVSPDRARGGGARGDGAATASAACPSPSARKLVGILTNRDLRFETRTNLPVSELMTKDDLITVPVGTTLEQAKEILHRHKVEKLLVVDRDYNLKGLITVKDIQKQIKYPNACKDSLGRLRVGAARRRDRRRPRPRGRARRGQGGRARHRHRARPHHAACWRRSRPSRSASPTSSSSRATSAPTKARAT